MSSKNRKMYTFYYKVTDVMDYSEHFAEHNIESDTITQAREEFDKFSQDYQKTHWDVITLLRIVSRVSTAEFDMVKWIIEG